MDAQGLYLYYSNMSPLPNRILNYNLFGEQGDLPDVVHCETIEARSRLHDWEFAPHRHAGLHQVVLLQDGGGRASLDGREIDLAKMQVVNVPRGIVHGYAFWPETTGLVVTVAAEMLDATLRPDEGVAQVLSRPAAIAARAEVAATFRDMALHFASRGFARAQILRALCGVLLGQIAQSLAEQGHTSAATPAPALLTRFEALLDRHFAAHWRVSDYADALAVSATHLSRVIRASTGRPASGLIEERVIREARRNLVYTNLPISTIAYELGFDDPAYFSRVFSRATGLSPRGFRERAAG